MLQWIFGRFGFPQNEFEVRLAKNLLCTIKSVRGGEERGTDKSNNKKENVETKMKTGERVTRYWQGIFGLAAYR